MGCIADQPFDFLGTCLTQNPFFGWIWLDKACKDCKRKKILGKERQFNSIKIIGIDKPDNITQKLSQCP